ncbi:hypothetical protein X975_14431, partial [Stegodyphus mimosarum]
MLNLVLLSSFLPLIRTQNDNSFQQSYYRNFVPYRNTFRPSTVYNQYSNSEATTKFDDSLNRDNFNSLYRGHQDRHAQKEGTHTETARQNMRNTERGFENRLNRATQRQKLNKLRKQHSQREDSRNGPLGLDREREGYKHQENLLVDDKTSVVPHTKRSPRIVQYVADKNGVAVREDLMQPFDRRSNQRILTTQALLQKPLMAHVVTSAIRVTGQTNHGGGNGKFFPKVFDIKVGK